MAVCFKCGKEYDLASALCGNLCDPCWDVMERAHDAAEMDMAAREPVGFIRFSENVEVEVELSTTPGVLAEGTIVDPDAQIFLS